MTRIAVFHYNPLELFPPAMNMINSIANEGGSDMAIRVFTMSAGKRFAKYDPPVGSNVKIFRIGHDNPENLSFLFKIAHYLAHYLFSIVYCIFWRPSRLFYIETISAPAPLVLKNLFLQKARLLVHFHEYMSPAEFSRTAMMKRVYRYECRNLYKAAWVSHTNEDRMRMFREDLGVRPNMLQERIMPNYPSRTWAGNNMRSSWLPSKPLRIVYVGAVDLDHLYFAEFINWVENQGGDCTLDVISNQETTKVESYAKSRNAQFVSFRSSIPYFELPAELVHYDVGVILYKGTSANFMFNAPNKLFEYLNMGLDVWFPQQLKGIQPYIRKDAHPMVLPLDFHELGSYTLNSIYGSEQHPFIALQYDAETVYKDLVKALFVKN